MRPAHYLVVALAGLLVHGAVLAFVVQRHGSIDGYALASLDAHEYVQLGRSIAEHGVFSTDEAPPFSPDFWRTPGYPLFLAAVFLVFGPSLKAAILVQQVVAIVTPLVLLREAARDGGTRCAMAAALLLACEPFGAFYSTWLLATTWFTFLLVLVWTCVRRSSPWVVGPLAGGLAGLAILTRPVALLVPILLVLELGRRALFERQLPRRGRARGAAVGFAVAAAVVCGAWMLRNQAMAGHAALSNQGGVVMAYFKATEVVLWDAGRGRERFLETSLDAAKRDEPHTVWAEIDARLHERMGWEDPKAPGWRELAQGNRSAFDSFVVSDALYGVGLEMLRERPWATLACGVSRMGALLAFPLSLAIEPPAGLARSRSRDFAVGIGYGLVSLAALLGVVVWWRRTNDVVAVWRSVAAPLCILAALLAATTPQLDPRFRVPMIPFLLYLATVAWCVGRDEGRQAGNEREAAPTEQGPSD